MNNFEEYKKIYFNLLIANKKINSLKKDQDVIDYINNELIDITNNYIVKRYIELNNEKDELLLKLNKYYDNNYSNPLELIDSIYTRIKEVYPNIDNHKLNYYIKCALYNMRYKDNNFNRQQSRIRRLKLDSFYNNWHYKIERN